MIRRRTTAWIAAVTLLAGGCGSASQAPSAAEQVPHLDAVLSRVDAALAAHRYAAARQDLRTLKSAVLKARDAGQLRGADAARVLDATARLLAQIPEGSSTPTVSPGTTAPSTTTSPRPTASASSSPARPKSTAAKPSASPTATPSPVSTPSPTPSASPAGPTAQVSPAAASVSPSP